MIPTFAAALIFDLGLALRRERRPFAGKTPAGPVLAGILAYALVLAFVGFLAFGTTLDQSYRLMRFEALAAPAFLITVVLCPSLPLLAIALPIVLVSRSATPVRGRK